MSKFNGMALYTEEEVGKAIENHITIYNKYYQIQRNAIKATKETDTSYRMFGFLWKVERTAYMDMESDCSSLYGTYIYMFDWLKDKDFITSEERKGINNHVYCWNKEYYSIKDLYNDGRDCYLNPEQAKFVNYYKKLNIEEE